MPTSPMEVATQCRDSAEENRLSFPEILGLLQRNNFEGYCVDFRARQATYYLADGESVALPIHDFGSAIAPAFDASRVASAVKEAQANGPDYSYLGFCRKVTAAGCAGYLVSLSGRRVLYFGRTAEIHLELFPSQG